MAYATPDLNFQSFNYNTVPQPYEPTPNKPDMSEGVTLSSIRRAFSTGDYDEQTLLQELDINFVHVYSKGKTVLNPFGTVDRNLMDDTDLVGPLLFCFVFALFLLLNGKIHFGFIYGVAMVGVLCMYAILNLMSSRGVDGYRVASILGYSLLPIVILSAFTVLLSNSGWLLGATVIAVLWSASSAAKMFVSTMEMREQTILVAYPVALLYSAFAIVAVF